LQWGLHHFALVQAPAECQKSKIKNQRSRIRAHREAIPHLLISAS
jgi:hypothetical protein